MTLCCSLEGRRAKLDETSATGMPVGIYIMKSLGIKLTETVNFLKNETKWSPSCGVILGTGLGDLVQGIDQEGTLDYDAIPYFPTSTALSHAGSLFWGRWSGHKIFALQGRFHYYEGYSLQQVVFPVRVMKLLGCHILITTNAAGSLNPDMKAGSIMVVTDHINLLGDNPLLGPNLEEMGPRFPDMSRAYDPELIAMALKVTKQEGLDVKPGVLTAVSGPNYETAAEYRSFRVMGADAVGMSIIPDAIAAAHCGMRVLAFSGLTDECFHEELEPLSAEQVVAVANKIAPALRKLITGVLERISE